MNPVRNPYNPGAGTRPPALVGRDDLLSAFDVTLQRAKNGKPGKSFMPIGLRGVGKTVLLNQFVEQGKLFGFKTVVIEAPETGNLAILLAAQLRPVLYELDRLGSLSEAVKRGLRILKSFSITPRADGIPTFEVSIDPEKGVADSGDLSQDMTDLLTAAGEAARDRKSGLLIAIDEVQYLRENELAALIAAIHRTTQRGLPVVLAGTGLPQIPALVGDAKSYAERLFTFPVIDSLPDAQAREALEKPAQEEGVFFEEAALAEIVRLTRGYPYFLQEWAYHVWNHADASPIRLADVQNIETHVFNELDAHFFRVRFDRLTPAERKYLYAMASLGPGPHRSGEIARKYRAKVESVANVRSALIKKGMIYSPQHGDTTFTVPHFDEFLLRAMPGQ